MNTSAGHSPFQLYFNRVLRFLVIFYIKKTIIPFQIWWLCLQRISHIQPLMVTVLKRLKL